MVRLDDREGLSGWGECVAARDPLYSEETVATAEWMVLERLAPLLARGGPTSIRSFRAAARRFRGNRMAKAAVEAALVDLVAREANVPAGYLLGRPVRGKVPVGVSVGIQKDPASLARRVGRYLEEGYGRIKIKVAPGRDRAFVRAVRRAYPEIELWVDGNQGYHRRGLSTLRSWAERYEVEQVEQPFGDRELLAHAALQRGARFRVCLDESIVDEESLTEALQVRALRSLNVKTGRVGGAIAGAELAREARRAGVACWVGGMLESGVGRALNLHLASLSPFNLSHDLSASSRYYVEDLIEEPFLLGAGSVLELPKGAGSGVTINPRIHRRAVRRRRRISLRSPRRT